MQDLHVAGVRRVAVARLRGDLGSAHDLRKRRVLEVGEPRAVLRVGQEQVPQPEPSRLRLQLLHHGRIGVPRPGLGQLLGIHLLSGIHVLVHERDQPLLEVLGSLRRLEVYWMLLQDVLVSRAINRAEANAAHRRTTASSLTRLVAAGYACRATSRSRWRCGSGHGQQDRHELLPTPPTSASSRSPLRPRPQL